MSKQIAAFGSVPVVLKALDRLEIDIRNAPSFDVLMALADVAAGLQRRWRPVKDVADRAGECWGEAVAKLGDELARVGKAKGTRGTMAGKQPGTSPKGKGGATGKAVLAPPVAAAPSAKELGISKRQATLARKLHELGRAMRKRLESELKADDRPVTPNTVLALARNKNKVDKKHQIAVAAFSETGPFDVAVIDPPWPMQKIDREERPNQDAFDYPTMSEADLTAFWKNDLAAKLATDCHVFCFTTQKFLPMALRVLEAAGLRYVLLMVWHKPGGFQPVGLPQYNCEFIVYARQGAPMFIDTKDFNCCFEAARREHSRKPDEFYNTIRRVTGGSRIDVFSREKREGFAQYGNEMQKFAEAV